MQPRRPIHLVRQHSHMFQRRHSIQTTTKCAICPTTMIAPAMIHGSAQQSHYSPRLQRVRSCASRRTLNAPSQIYIYISNCRLCLNTRRNTRQPVTFLTSTVPAFAPQSVYVYATVDYIEQLLCHSRLVKNRIVVVQLPLRLRSCAARILAKPVSQLTPLP